MSKLTTFWKSYFVGAAVTGVVLAYGAYKSNAFAIEDYAKLSLVDMQGQPVDLQQYANRPLVVNYWATWCKPCIEEFPGFEASRRQVGQGVTFLMISDDPLAKVQRFVRNKPYGFVFLKSTKPLSLHMRPVTYFYNRDHSRSYKQTGAFGLDSARVNDYLRRIR